VSEGATTAPAKTGLNIYEIQRILPHAYPMLLVDRVESVEPGVRCVGYKNVSINEPFFAGHFPRHPVMPGVLVVEAMCQVGAILGWYDAKEAGHENALQLLVGLDQVKLRKPVIPGDRLRMEINVVRRRTYSQKLRGVATVDGTVVAEGDLLARTVPDVEQLIPKGNV